MKNKKIFLIITIIILLFSVYLTFILKKENRDPFNQSLFMKKNNKLLAKDYKKILNDCDEYFKNKEKIETFLKYENYIVQKGDYDNDGKYDKIILYPKPIKIFLSKNNRTYKPLFVNVYINGGFCDLNMDGYEDIWLYNLSDNLIRIIWGNEEGLFKTHQMIKIKSNYSIIYPLDIDNDGDYDFVLIENKFIENYKLNDSYTEIIWLEIDIIKE